MNSADITPGRAARPSFLLGDPAVIGPARLADRLRARAFGASLDQQLAAGHAPESSRPLAARAQRIVALPRRACLARNWDHLLRVAERAGTGRGPVVSLNVSAILAAEPAIRELIRRLSAPLPVAAQGVAAAYIPLANADSPVFNRHSRDSLADLLDAAITHLDPARPLMDA